MCRKENVISGCRRYDNVKGRSAVFRMIARATPVTVVLGRISFA